MEQITISIISQILNSGIASALLFGGILYLFYEVKGLKAEIKSKDATIAQKDETILNYSERIAKLEGKHEAMQVMLNKFTKIEELIETEMIKTSQKKIKK